MRGKASLLGMMAKWNTGTPSPTFEGETTLSCPDCDSTDVVISCNSFYGAATPWQTVECRKCGRKDRTDRVDLP